MKRRIMAMFPEEFRDNPVHFQALGLAFVYVTMALLQLFTFESFVEVTLNYGLPGGRVTAVAIAFLIPITEVMALPYLLSMRLPRRIYIISRASVLATATLWFLIALWTNTSGNNDGSLGIFGATLDTPNQWWSVVFIGFVVWAAWLIYSAKPIRHRVTSARKAS